MFRTKFTRVADPLFYILGGNNAFNQSKAIDKLEGYISQIFAAISSRMQGPNKDRYGYIYRVRHEKQEKTKLISICSFSIMVVMDLILQFILV
jgi:hypothetical protein